MTNATARLRNRFPARAVLTLVGALTLLWAAGMGAAVLRPDEWQRLIETGDALAAGGRVPVGGPAGLSARAAYLLAFHHAQDAADVRRMLVAADRLEGLGERVVAEYTRHVAAVVAASAQAPPRPRAGSVPN